MKTVLESCPVFLLVFETKDGITYPIGRFSSKKEAWTWRNFYLNLYKKLELDLFKYFMVIDNTEHKTSNVEISCSCGGSGLRMAVVCGCCGQKV